jgi:hypothetical protein
MSDGSLRHEPAGVGSRSMRKRRVVPEFDETRIEHRGIDGRPQPPISGSCGLGT